MKVVKLVDYKQQRFKQLARKILRQPEHYLDFDSVSDFFKAAWLAEFPSGTSCLATGLDDGAEEFYALIQ